MKIIPIQTDIFKESADLPAFIVRHIPSVADKTVLTVSSKLDCLW